MSLLGNRFGTSYERDMIIPPGSHILSASFVNALTLANTFFVSYSRPANSALYGGSTITQSKLFSWRDVRRASSQCVGCTSERMSTRTDFGSSTIPAQRYARFSPHHPLS